MRAAPAFARRPHLTVISSAAPGSAGRVAEAAAALGPDCNTARLQHAVGPPHAAPPGGAATKEPGQGLRPSAAGSSSGEQRQLCAWPIGAV